MNVNFQRSKIQKYLPHILIGVLLITALIVWLGFLRKEEISLPEISIFPQKIEINFEVLENPFLDELESFEKIQLPEGGVKTGRSNPFIPY